MRVHPTPAEVYLAVLKAIHDYNRAHPEDRLHALTAQVVLAGVARANAEHEAAQAKEAA